MTKKELENKISELEKQIIELKEELEKENSKTPVGKIWKPKENESYVCYSIFTDDYCKELNTRTNFDIRVINSGMAYSSEEKAEFEAQREKYTRLFRQYVEQHSEPLDWQNDSQFKHCVYYDYEEQKIDYWTIRTCCRLCSIYASSREVLKEAIDFVGEENVKKYILEIGE